MNIVTLYKQALGELQKLVVSTEPSTSALDTNCSNCAFESLESLQSSLQNKKTTFADVEKFIQFTSTYLKSPILESHTKLIALFTNLNDFALYFFLKQRIESEGFDKFYEKNKAKGSNLELNSQIACVLAHYLLTEKKIEGGVLASFLKSNMPKGDLFALDRCEYGIMHQASINPAYLALLEWLIAQGGDVNQKGLSQATPLHLAASCCFETTKYLLEKGADKSAKDIIGNPPCYYATRSGNLDILKILTELDPIAFSYRNSLDQNLLHHATASNANENLAIVRFLVENGVNHLTVDFSGATPLNIAMEFKIPPVNSYLELLDRDFSKFWLQLKKLSLQFSIPGFCALENIRKIEPQFSRPAQTFATLTQSIEEFSRQSCLETDCDLSVDEWKVINQEFNLLFEKSNEAYELDLGNPKLRNAFAYFWHGKTISETGHILGMMVSGDELFICDRLGDELLAKSGIVIYDIGNKENGKNLLKDISYLNLAPSAKKEFFSQLHEHLALTEKKYYSQKPQKGNNCTYSSMKTLFKAMVYDVLHKRGLPLNVVERKTKQIYKTWSHFDKKQTVINFIEAFKSVTVNPAFEKYRASLISIGQDTLTYILFKIIGNMEKTSRKEIFEIIVNFMPELTHYYHSEIKENLLLTLVQMGEVELVEELVDRFNLDLSSLGKKSRTVFHYAAKKEDLRMVNFFIKRVPSLCNHINKDFKTPLSKAVERGNVAIAQALLENGAFVDNIMLEQAGNENSNPAMSALLEKYMKIQQS